MGRYRNRWRRGSSYGLLLALCLQPLSHATADDAPGSRDAMPFLGGYIRDTRIVYPLQIDGWRAQGEHRYDQAELGVSVRYAHEDAAAGWLDIYLYPVGEVGAQALDAHMAQTIAELQGVAGETHGRTIRFGAVSAERVVLDGVDADSADGELRTTAGVMSTGGTSYHSALAIGLRRYYFIKARYSAPQAALPADAVATMVAGVVRGFMQDTRIDSTGSCGTALPVEVIDGGAPLPDQGRFEASRDEMRRAVLTADFRVVAYVPADPEVELLRGLGKMQRDDLYPGCAGETPVEPDVPDSHREIRIEYRPPSRTSRSM